MACVPCLESLLLSSTPPWPPEHWLSTLCLCIYWALCEPSFLFTLSGFLAIRVTSQRSSFLFQAAGYCILLFPGISHSRPGLMICILVLDILVSLQSVNSSKTGGISYLPLASLWLAKCLYTVGAKQWWNSVNLDWWKPFMLRGDMMVEHPLWRWGCGGNST